MSLWYQPLKDEPDLQTCPLFQSLKTIRLFLPQDQTIDPISLAKSLSASYQDVKAFILIPGTAFDLKGTRHGRGSGWFDRFLAHVPRPWIRIGVAKEEQISKTPLKRESWDEPMDWLLVQKSDQAWIPLIPPLEHRRLAD
jgi:5,10-methenyltetrahydrofolate synthetase